MAKQPNMKIGIGADTSDFDKGAKQVKQGLKDLSKTGGEALGSLGEAFGVNTGKVGQMTSAIRGLGAKMTEASNTGVQAFGKLLGSITPLGGAIAGLGLGAAIAGFKQLKAEAESFKSTVDGMNLSMGTAAYIATYRQALHDANSETGRAVAEAMAEWEKGFGRFRANLGASLAVGMSDSRWYDALLPTGIIRGWRTVKQGIDDATAAAERNEALASQLADIQKEELRVRKEVADIEVQISEQRRILRDRSASVEERTAAEAETRRLIAERSEKQTDIARRLYEVTQAMTDETGSTYEEVAKCVSLYEQWQGRIAATENEMAGVDRYANSIGNGMTKAAQAARELEEATRKMNEAQAKWSGLGTVSTAGINPMFPGVTTPTESIISKADTERWYNAIRAQMGDMVVGIRFRVDNKQEIVDITNEVVSLVESAASRTGEILGGLVGDLISGGDAWGDFKNAAVAAFGDMAIAIGKVAIAAGTAALGIDAMLKNPSQGALAIAAGIALVALGTAVKASLSSVASGDYSAAGGGYTSAASSGSSGNYETREVTVNVTGTLEADGDKLVTVLNNTNRKKYYTQ